MHVPKPQTHVGMPQTHVGMAQTDVRKRPQGVGKRYYPIWILFFSKGHRAVGSSLPVSLAIRKEKSTGSADIKKAAIKGRLFYGFKKL
jgi:hypothetical protein